MAWIVRDNQTGEILGKRKDNKVAYFKKMKVTRYDNRKKEIHVRRDNKTKKSGWFW